MTLPSPPTEVTYRKASADDVEVLLPLVEEYHAFDGIPFDEAAVRRGLHALVANPSFGGAWLIQRGLGFAGYFLLTFGFDLEFGGRQATITELYLAPASRKRGLGTKTLLFVEGLLREDGIGAFELQVERDNTEARAFYEKFGMKAHDRVPMSKRVPAR